MSRLSMRAGAAIRGHWLVLFGLAAVAGLVIAVDPGQVVAALAGADRKALFLMLPCVLLLYLAHGVAWWFALRGAGARVAPGEAIRVMLVSQAFVFVPGGDLWRVPLVRRPAAAELAAGELAATVVFDDLVYFYVLTAAMVPAAAATPALLAPLAVALLPQTAIFAILLWPGLYTALATRVARLPLIRRFRPHLELLGPAFRRLFTVRTLAPVVVADALCAGLAISLFALALRAVHAHGVGLQQVAFTYSAGQIASGLSVVPGALGVYEGMMTGLIAVQGVAPAVAAAAALIYRACNDVLMALLGLALLTGRHRPARALGRVLSGAPWAALRLGRSGRGRASGIPWAWAAWEALTLRLHPLTPVRPGGLFCYRVTVHRGEPVRLRDGARVARGHRILDLHIDNRRLAVLRSEPAYSTWRAMALLAADLDALAERVASDLTEISAVHAVSLLGEAGGRLGFEVRRLPHTPRTALERYFMAGLDAIYHPTGLARLNGAARRRWPVEIWLSREALIARRRRSGSRWSDDVIRRS